jgi:hypothetical protein
LDKGLFHKYLYSLEVKNMEKNLFQVVPIGDTSKLPGIKCQWAERYQEWWKGRGDLTQGAFRLLGGCGLLLQF